MPLAPPDTVGGFGSTSEPGSAHGLLVVVHPAGRLDDSAAASYWTEVPDLPACSVEAPSIEEAVARTRESICRWLLSTVGVARTPADLALRVELAV